MRRFATLAALLLLAGCGQQVAGIQTMPAPQTPDQGLFEAETAYDLALKQVELVPLCSATVTAACLSGPQMAQAYVYALDGVKALNAAKAAVAQYDAIKSPTAAQTSAALQVVSALATVAQQLTALVPAKQGG